VSQHRIRVTRRGIQVILLGPRGVPAGAAEDPTTMQALLSALTGNEHVPTAVTDIGLLTLMVTPVISVVVSLVSFARARAWTYVPFAPFLPFILALTLTAGHPSDGTYRPVPRGPRRAWVAPPGGDAQEY